MYVYVHVMMVVASVYAYVQFTGCLHVSQIHATDIQYTLVACGTGRWRALSVCFEVYLPFLTLSCSGDVTIRGWEWAVI